MIKLIKSTFYREAETKKALQEFIAGADQLSIGKECANFEKAFAEWQGRTHCVMVSSGSAANLALLQALKNLGRLAPGSRIAFSSITWATNVAPIIQLGFVPVPVDISMETLNTSPQTLKEAYEKNPFECFFITNMLGYSDHIGQIQEFCEERGILLIEDNCESLGSEYEGKKLGNFSLASTFSFFVGHHMSTIEGGAVCTDDQELDIMLRMVRSHGWDRHLSSEEQQRIRAVHGVDDFHAKYTFYDLGYNLRPTEIQGFLGTNQLAYLHEMIDKREANYKAFEAVYANEDFYPITNVLSRNSNFAFPLICRSAELKDYYVQKAHEHGIEVRPIVGGNMVGQPFFKKYTDIVHDMPNASAVHEYGFYFGNNPEMTDEEVQTLVETFITH